MTLGVLLASVAPLARGLLAPLVVLGAFAPVAHADVIVFTGPGGGPRQIFGWSLTETVWLAGEFTIAEAHTVTSVEGWISTFDSGDLTVKLYAGAGDVPGTPLFAKTMRIEPMRPAWVGATNVEWLIHPGTYWAAFEAAGTFHGAMPNPSLKPVANEASGSAAGYVGVDELDFGLRVLGDPVGTAPIPEPATFTLLGTGAVALAGRAWRRRKQRP